MSRFINALHEEIADLERQLRGNPIYIKLTEARHLLHVYEEVVEPPVGVESLRHAPAQEVSQRHEASGMLTVVDAAKQVLERESRPIPTIQLLDLLRPMGVTFGGKTPQNSLSSILSKSGIFKPNGRAGWTLAGRRNPVETKMTDDATPEKESSPAIDVAPSLAEILGMPPAEGREAVPGGGT